MENLSDREMEGYCQENIGAKWFYHFQLTGKTPDYTVFCKARKRIGTQRVSTIFSEINDTLKAQGDMSEAFIFLMLVIRLAK